MFCKLEYTGKTSPDGRFLHKCAKCDNIWPSVHSDPNKLRAPCRFGREPPAPRSEPRGGPGTELTALTSELRLKPSVGCKCKARAHQMDLWGVAGCLYRFDECVSWMREAYAETSWAQYVKAGAMAALTGLAREINWRDPCPDMVTVAIRRAQAKEVRPRFVTLEDRDRAMRALLRKLPPEIAGVVGVARSGMAPAGDVAGYLHLPLYTLSDDGVSYCGNGWRLNDGRPLPDGLLGPLRGDGPVLVVDDTLMTGGSLLRSRALVPRCFPGRKVLYACCLRNPGKHVPDFWGEDLPGLHFLEWNLFNSCHLPRMGTDFDGILTYDGTVDPQYLIRKRQVPLIATGRSESDREGSEAWLKMWGVGFERMAMWRGGDLFAEVGSKVGPVLAVSKHKAEAILADKRIFYFAESDDRQAREIAKLTGCMVVCPASKVVY